MWKTKLEDLVDLDQEYDRIGIVIYEFAKFVKRLTSLNVEEYVSHFSIVFPE